MEVLILIGLIVLNGLFAMSEIAIVTAKKSRLTALASKGRPGAKTALRLADDPTQFLSTVQIGITSIGILNGIFGESVLAEPFARWLQQLGLSATASATTATVLVVVVVTYVSIVVGELVPKRIGQVRAETLACWVARPMSWLALAAKPFVLLLTHSTHGLIRLLPLTPTDDPAVTEEDIEAMLLEGSTSGVIEQEEHVMVKNVLRLDDRLVTSLMVPRSDVIFLDIAVPIEENYRRMMTSPHSTFPVCRQRIDDLVGVVQAKDLLGHIIAGGPVDLTALVQPAGFVLEHLSALDLLEHFKSSNIQMVFVVDEYGNLQGIVTLQDLVEALTGEFSGDGEESWVVVRDDGSLLLDGLLPAVDVKDRLDLSELPSEGEYQTLNGLILTLADRIPAAGEKFTIQDWQLEIMDMDGNRVDKVLALKLAGSDNVDDDGSG